MPARLFIQQKRKSYGQETLDESMENNQKRRCLGSLDSTSGSKFSAACHPVQQDTIWVDEMIEDDNDGFFANHEMPTESNNNSCNNYNYNLPTPCVTNVQHSSAITNGSDQLSKQEESSALMNGCDMEFDSFDETNTTAASTTPSTYYEQLNVILGPSDRFCVGGTFVHRPGLNRSYCKPSWDAMTEMRPYVSDYY